MRTGFEPLHGKGQAKGGKLKRLMTCGLGTLLLATSGCATIFSSSGQDINITSNVEGAEVLLDGIPIGETPLTFYLDRDTFKRHELTLRHEDHRTRTVQVHKTLNSTALSNCTFILSWGTDALTGAMMEYSPESYFIELQPKREQRATQDRELMLFIVASSTRLLVDIARGDGEALRAVEKISGVPPDSHNAFLAALRLRLDAMGRARWPTRLFDYVHQANPAAEAATR
jgi:hypothetical protein